MLTVLIASTGTQLTTLEALKAHLGTTSTANDDLLSSAIDQASAAIETYVGYPLSRAVYQETVAGYGNLKLLLSRTPIRAIDSITYQGMLVPSTGYEIDAQAGIVHRDQGWPWTAGVEWDLESRVVAKSERPAFTAIYEAGYLLGAGAGAPYLLNGGRTLPYDLEKACLDTAKTLYLNRAMDPTISSRRIGDLSITYRGGGNQALSQSPSSLLPDEVAGSLHRYRRVR